MNNPQSRKKSQARAHRLPAGHATPAQLAGFYDRLDKVNERLDAVERLFLIISDHTPDHVLVGPLARSGAQLTENISDDLGSVLLRMGCMSGQLLLEEVA